MKPIVTVGVCVRNAAFTIREAIESIIGQDFRHELMELVIVDGHSNDETLSIIKDLLNNTDIKSRIFYENKGLGYARQIVVDNARGAYIVWVDGDMIISKDYVRKQAEFMECHSEVGIAKGIQTVKPGSNLLATLETYSRAAGRMVDYTSEKAKSKSMGTSGCIYRVKAIRQVGGFDENIAGYGEDFDAEYRIRKAGWVLCTTDVQYYDYERGRILWKDLWLRYFKRGYDLQQVWHKKERIINPYKMLPPAAFLAGLVHSFKIYSLTNQKVVFLLPLQHAFKSTAWWVGYTRSSLDSYESTNSGKRAGR
jgi:glycosyltransferase involved in cell wall biosynthesis